jgi:hypothetical protein
VEAARSGTEGFTLATKWESGDDDDLVSVDVLTHRVRASCAGDVFVEEERLEENGAWVVVVAILALPTLSVVGAWLGARKLSKRADVPRFVEQTFSGPACPLANRK